ncbi:MAG: YabP/YqfC family sporulation protein [Oscillospiraceae bacterium]|nr:YabP/YqfC family sporulation protein [Oscillospiraceae bacterium]MBQ7012676.1 YabP/YqfC family sporulation protein [Oscillospiraceae bacterium]
MPKRLRRTFQSLVYLDTHVSLRGNRAVHVENCRRILEYHDVLVRLRTRDMELEIWGTGLRVHDFHDGSVDINGCISSISIREVK